MPLPRPGGKRRFCFEGKAACCTRAAVHALTALRDLPKHMIEVAPWMSELEVDTEAAGMFPPPLDEDFDHVPISCQLLLSKIYMRIMCCMSQDEQEQTPRYRTK